MIARAARSTTESYRSMRLTYPPLPAYFRAAVATARLDPGSYGPTTVSGTLVLSSGKYSFPSLTVLEGARLVIDATDGPVTLEFGVSATLTGAVEALPGELLIELTGQGALRIERG